MNFRIGFGFDVHPLEEGPRLVIGGIDIPWNKGCAGHSDGDPLIHAICDAMLGAVAAGDIGTHFPDTSPEFKGIDSRILLARTNEIIRIKGYRLIQIDSTICLEKPKIASYLTSMVKSLADILGTDPENISVKATTTEKLGFVGREEGVAAYAVVLLEKMSA
ncbi:MAG: 2-C-methyl-D-erythritol 2,4-cyclodiphosphate synthase [Bacteroides sp. SM23_62_1]|nr:MAG: 2-C-methyl-D-erythritol 2,4-cyclodiphosphate synthase [Bacteroides sp. SM23_62_1]